MNTRNEKILSALWMLLATCSSQNAQFECQYAGDMCDVTDDCLLKMKEEGKIKTCPGRISYGPGNTLFDTREDQPFWIAIHKDDRYRYKLGTFDITYTIVSEPSPDFDAPVSRVPSCCSLKLNESCILPKKRTKSEVLSVVLPLLKKGNEGNHSYCFYELEERKGILENCEDEDQKNCLEFRDGRLYIRGAFRPLSVEKFFFTEVDYCFFPTPSEYVRANGSATPLMHQSNITRSGWGDKIAARFGGKDIECDIFQTKRYQNPVNISARYHESAISDFVCFFSRQPKYSSNWTRDPRCVLVQREMTDISPTVVVVVAIVCTLAAVLLIAIALIWLYRNHITKCTFKRNIEDLPHALPRRNSKGEIFTHVRNEETNIHLHQADEIPIAITFENDDGITQEKKNAVPEETNLLDDSKRQSKTESIISETNGKSDASLIPEGQDSGFCSVKGDQEEEQSHERKFDEKNEIETNEADSGLELTPSSPDAQSTFDTENMKTGPVVSDDYAAKHVTISTNASNNTSSDVDPSNDEGLLHRNWSSSYSEANALFASKGFESPQRNKSDESSHVAEDPCHQHVLPVVMPAMHDGYFVK